MDKNMELTYAKELYDTETIEILDICTIKLNDKEVACFKYKCFIDGYEGHIPIDDIKAGQRCQSCSGTTLFYGNRVSLARPDLVKYFKNKEDADNYTFASDKKVQLICPDCGMLKTKEVKISNLNYQGFSCDYCSDGISTPEKFGIYLFKQLGIDFETQKIFDWSQGKRYDKYFSFKNNEYIIEIHGKQHYIEQHKTSKFKITLDEQIMNDKIKYELAIKNGINPKNYIIIDARHSNFDWLKHNYFESLVKHFDLSTVDWHKAWEDCQNSMVVQVWEAWNNKTNEDSIKTIAKKFKLSDVTIRNYLNRGNKINRCVYDGKVELIKSANINGILLGQRLRKKVYKYSPSGEFLCEYESGLEAYRQIGVNDSHISSCCVGKRKHAGGFKWSHNPPTNGMYPD